MSKGIFRGIISHLCFADIRFLMTACEVKKSPGIFRNQIQNTMPMNHLVIYTIESS